MLRLLRAPLVASACALVGCGPSAGTDVGNGRTGFNLQGYEETNTTSAQSLTLSTGVVVDALYMVVEQVRLVPGTECQDGDDGEVELEGPFVADLVGEGVLGGPPSFTSPVGSFCELSMDFHRLESGDVVPAAAPDALLDRSILLLGTQPNGDRFTVESELNEAFELGAKDGSFELGAAQQSLVLAFEIGSWIGALDLGTLGGGEVTINADENQDRLNDFEDAVKRSAKLFRDRDGDGDVDPDERVDGEELAD